MNDPRAGLATYYDFKPDFPDDVPFYLRRLPSAAPTILELGCGTGRVSVPLAARSRSFVGVDHSIDMIARCRERLVQAGVATDRARVEVADITSLSLNRTFEFIVAPFRVLQNLEADVQVQGLFTGIRQHLAEDGRCILNTFRPNRSGAELIRSWSTGQESEAWSVPTANGRIVCSDRRAGVRADPLTLYPELVYRRYDGDVLVDEAILSIAMRCYYPDDLLELIRSAGFRITGAWGGYAGEPYGEGPELVVEFASEA